MSNRSKTNEGGKQTIETGHLRGFPRATVHVCRFHREAFALKGTTSASGLGGGIDRQQLLGLCGMFVSGPEQPSASFQRSARSVKKKTTWYIYRVRHVLGVKVR
jgi:hypothetical protein